MTILICANQKIKVPSDLVTFVHSKSGSPGFKSVLMTCKLWLIIILRHPYLFFETCTPLT